MSPIGSVALTASAFDQDRDRFLAGDCDEFARKPFLAEELFAILERRAGLRFVRAGETPAAGVALSPVELASRLAGLPEDWRTALQDALKLGDFERITALVGQVRDSDAARYPVLAHWAYNYDLDAFARLPTGGGGP